MATNDDPMQMLLRMLLGDTGQLAGTAQRDGAMAQSAQAMLPTNQSIGDSGPGMPGMAGSMSPPVPQLPQIPLPGPTGAYRNVAGFPPVSPGNMNVAQNPIDAMAAMQGMGGMMPAPDMTSGAPGPIPEIGMSGAISRRLAANKKPAGDSSQGPAY